MKLKTGKLAACSLAAVLAFGMGASVNIAYASAPDNNTGGGCTTLLPEGKPLDMVLQDISKGNDYGNDPFKLLLHQDTVLKYKRMLETYKPFLTCLLRGNDTNGGLGQPESGKLANFVWMNKGKTTGFLLPGSEINEKYSKEANGEHVLTYPATAGTGEKATENENYAVVNYDKNKDKYPVQLKADFEMDPVLARTVVATNKAKLLDTADHKGTSNTDKGKTYFLMHYRISDKVKNVGKVELRFTSKLFQAVDAKALIANNNGEELDPMAGPSLVDGSMTTGSEAEAETFTLDLSKSSQFTLVAKVREGAKELSLNDSSVGNTSLESITPNAFFIDKATAEEYLNNKDNWIHIAGDIEGHVYANDKSYLGQVPAAIGDPDKKGFPIKQVTSQDYMNIRFVAEIPVPVAPAQANNKWNLPDNTPADSEYEWKVNEKGELTATIKEDSKFVFSPVPENYDRTNLSEGYPKVSEDRKSVDFGTPKQTPENPGTTPENPGTTPENPGTTKPSKLEPAKAELAETGAGLVPFIGLAAFMMVVAGGAVALRKKNTK